MSSLQPLLKAISLALAACLAMMIAPAAHAACMTVTAGSSEQVTAESRGKTFEVLVADEDVAAFSKRGLIQTECSGELQGAKAQQAARDEICAVTYSGNDAVQLQIEKAIGIHPGLLCASAEKMAGSWPGEKIGWRGGRAPWSEERSPSP